MLVFLTYDIQYGRYFDRLTKLSLTDFKYHQTTVKCFSVIGNYIWMFKCTHF